MWRQIEEVSRNVWLEEKIRNWKKPCLQLKAKRKSYVSRKEFTSKKIAEMKIKQTAYGIMVREPTRGLKNWMRFMKNLFITILFTQSYNVRIKVSLACLSYPLQNYNLNIIYFFHHFNDTFWEWNFPNQNWR